MASTSLLERRCTVAMLRAWARVVAVLAVVTLFAALLAAQGSLAAASSYTVAVQATPIYGLFKIAVTGLAGGITAATSDLYNGVEYIAGSGYLAALNVTAHEVLWIQSLEGKATLAVVDSTANASAVAVATDAGEVVVVSALTGDVLATYYVGQDSPIDSIELLRSPDGLKLAVHTADGYLRIYRVGSPYWVEIGPSPGQEPLRSLGGIDVTGAYAVLNITEWWKETSSSMILLRYTLVDPTLKPTLILNVYYSNGSTTLPAYNFQGLDLGNNRTLYADLRVWPLVRPYGSVEPWEPVPLTGNATVNTTNLYPGYYRIVAAYNYTVINSTNGQVIESHCYYGTLDISLGLAEAKVTNITLEETVLCPQNSDFTPQPIETYLILNTTGLPENFTLESLKPLLSPKPPGTITPSIVGAYLAQEPPPGWTDYNATALLVEVYNTNNNSDLRLVYLASNLTPVVVNVSASEYMLFEAPISSVSLTPALDRIYIGTSAGTLYLARWLPGEGRYVASNSIEATGDEPIVSIQPTPWNVTIAVGSSGAAQAVSEEDWQPIWRGGPGYPNLQLPLEGSTPLQVFAGPAIPLTIVPFLEQGTAPWLLSAQSGLWSTPPLSRVQVNLTVLLHKLDGTVEAESPGSGSYVAVYANGTLIAAAPAEDGLAALYLAPGNYTLLINATAWGAAEANLTVNTTDVTFQALLEFREVEIEVYTPPGPEPGYQLVAGPVANAALTAQPQDGGGSSTIRPIAGPVNASTDASGAALMILWSQLNYTLTAEKEDYLVSTTQILAGGPQNITIPLYPQLYPTEIAALDADAASAGVNYTTPDTVLVISNGQRQLTLQAPNGSIEVQLPAGTFLVQAQAPGYFSASLEASIPLNASIIIYLHPRTYQLTIQASVSDTLTPLASGPLAGAQVTLSLLTPPLLDYNATLVTDSNGVVVTTLRYGVYNLTVTYPYTQPYSAIILVNSTGTLQVIVEPKYSNLTVTLYDSQLQSLGVLAPNASLTLVYAPTGRTLALQAPNGTTNVVVPYGPYYISASAPHYYPYGPAGIDLREPQVRVNLSLNPVFYQLTVTVIVNDTVTGLASGPLVNAEVQAVLVQPLAPWINATAYTGLDGKATVTLRYGVYNLTVVHPYTQSYSALILVNSTGTLQVIVEPRYSNLTLTLYDSQLQDADVLVQNATITLLYIATGNSLTLQSANGVTSTIVPYGLYHLSASAPHYYPYGPADLDVAEPNVLVNVSLDPVFYSVTVTVLVNDTETGLASGPLANAEVQAVLVEPYAPWVNATTYTGSSGSTTLQLRYGLYNLTIKHPYVQSYTVIIAVDSAGVMQFAVLPKYSNLTVEIYDSQLQRIGVLTPNASVNLLYTVTGRAVTLQAPNGTINVLVPYGQYHLSVSAPHYYPYGPAGVEINGSRFLINVSLDPVYYDLAIILAVNDTKTGLASRPLAGASVEAVLVEPYAPWVNATVYTGSDGKATLTLRYGVYNLTVTHPYTQPYSVLVEVGSSGTLQLVVEPRYSNLTLAVYDSQLQWVGVLVSNASITLVYTSTGRSLTLQAPSGVVEAVLPYGSYQISVMAPHYYPYGPADLDVAEPNVLVNVSLDPVFYSVTVTVLVNDTETGLASGPLANAEVQAVLVEPYAPWVNATVYTGSDGKATLTLRYGVYNLTVTHPYTQPLTIGIRVEGPSDFTVAIEPRYTTLVASIYDSELYMYGITVSNATLTLTYTSTGRSISLELPTGSGTMQLPYGLYIAVASAPFYYPSQPQTLVATEPVVQFNVYLTPVKYEVTVRLVIDDTLWGLATGPAAGALVNFTLIQPQLPVQPVTGYTNQQGEVTMELRAGTFMVSIAHAIAANTQFVITVGADTSVTYTLHPDYASVELSVVDGETGLPIPGVVITLTYTSMGSPRSVSITLSNGTEEVQLPPGSYQFSVSEWHYYQTAGSFTLNKGASTSVTMHMQPVKVDVSVIVYSNRTETGGLVLPSRPLRGALVVLEPSDPVLRAVGAPTVSGTTSEDGSVHLTLRIGAYFVNLTKTHYKSLGEVQLITSSRTLEFALTPILYNVTLTIVDPEMLPGYRDLYNITFRVDSWDGYPVGASITVDSGDSIALPAGVYQVALSKTYYDTAQYTLAVMGSMSVELPLNATRYSVSVAVTAESSIARGAVVGVTLELVSSLPLENNVFTAITDDGGVASLSLRAGNYTVFLLGPGYQQPHTLGYILVEGPASATFEIQPPTANLSVTVVDAKYPIPVNATLELAYTGPYGTGSVKVKVNGSTVLALPAGSYVVTATADRYEPASLSVFLNSSSESIKITLQPILVPVTINVYDSDGNPVDGAVVRLVYEIPSLSPPPIITINGTAKPREGVRIGAYRVEVSPPPGSPLLPAAAPLDVKAGGGQVAITLPFRNFTVEIILKDSLTGKLVPFKYLAKLQRVGKGSETLRYPKEVEVVGGKANVTLPYGTYTLLLEPEAQDYYVIPQGITFHAEREGQQVVIQMKPRVYTVSVVVVDDRSRPVAGALVELVDTKTRATVASQLTDSTGSASFSVVYGLYEIRVTHKAYKEATAYIQVPQVTSTTVNVYPTPITALKRMAPLIVGVAGLALLGAVLWRAKEAIAARLAEQEEYF